MTLGAMCSECHIVKFKSHPTGVYRNCLLCGDKVNNTIHVLYHCPFAKVILNYVTTKPKLKINGQTLPHRHAVTQTCGTCTLTCLLGLTWEDY